MTILSVPAPLILAPMAIREICQIHHLRLARGILEHRLALGQGGGHHEILGAGDGDGFQHQPRALSGVAARALM